MPDRVKPSFVIFWHPGTLTLSPEGQSARMSKITNDGLTRSGTGCIIVVPIWQQWASEGWVELNVSINRPLTAASVRSILLSEMRTSEELSRSWPSPDLLTRKILVSWFLASLLHIARSPIPATRTRGRRPTPLNADWRSPSSTSEPFITRFISTFATCNNRNLPDCSADDWNAMIERLQIVRSWLRPPIAHCPPLGLSIVTLPSSKTVLPPLSMNRVRPMFASSGTFLRQPDPRLFCPSICQRLLGDWLFDWLTGGYRLECATIAEIKQTKLTWTIDSVITADFILWDWGSAIVSSEDWGLNDENEQQVSKTIWRKTPSYGVAFNVVLILEL